MGLPSYILPIMGKSQLELDPITVAWLAQLTTSFGSNPSSAFISALDTMIAGMRTDGDILLLDRFWIFAQEVQGYSTISIVNPSATAITEVNTPTWTANEGYTGDGSTEYLNTNFNYLNDAVNATEDSISHGVYITTNVSENKIDCGYYTAARDNILSARWGDGKYYASAMSSSLQVGAAVSDSLGMFSARRAAAGNYQTFENGAQVATASNASNSLPNGNDYVLAYLNGGTGLPTSYTTRRCAMRFIGSGAISQANFYARFQTFATSIGFDV